MRHADLTKPLDFGQSSWMLLLEVAEHVPAAHQAMLLANLDRHNTEGIVMSWSSTQSGVGHVNALPSLAVTRLFRMMNYTEDVSAGGQLRASVSTWPWFRYTRTRGKFGGGVRVWRRGGNMTEIRYAGGGSR